MFVILVSAISGCRHIIACSFQACGLSQFPRREKRQWPLLAVKSHYCHYCSSHGMSFIFPKCKLTYAFLPEKRFECDPSFGTGNNAGWELCTCLQGRVSDPLWWLSVLCLFCICASGRRGQLRGVSTLITLGPRSLLGECKGRKMCRATWQVI